MVSVTLKAYSKINIGLDVIGRRPNGYHDVRMIMQTLDLGDILTLTAVEEPGITISSARADLPLNEDNLIWKAGKLLMDEFHIPGGIHVDLEKNIPIAAGMAGGSSDAAAMLCGTSQLFSLGLSRQELMKRGVRIGADVPYCILQGTALSEGIGEILTPLPPMISCPVLIAKPGISVSTAFVYRNLKLEGNPGHPDIDRLMNDMKAGDLAALGAHLGNILETVTIPAYPVIDRIKEQMLIDGACGSLMSGSGPTVFGLFADEATAARAEASMRRSGLAAQVALTHIHNVSLNEKGSCHD